MKISDIDLRLLQVFRAVAEAGGFVKAQGVLGISQPTISSHISNLEQRLGVNLCLRGPQGFSLTPEGQRVLEESSALLDYISDATDRLKSIAQASDMQVSIGVVDAMITNPLNILPSVLRSACKAQPSLTPKITVSEFLNCLTELRGGRFDIVVLGFSDNETPPPDLETINIFNEYSSLFCAIDHPCAVDKDSQSLEERLHRARFSAHSFVTTPLGASLDSVLSEHNTEFSQGAVEATAHLVLAGSHVGLLPLHYAAPWVESGEMVEIGQDRFRILSRLHAARLKGQPMEPATALLWQNLEAKAQP